jgi:hypothetical protein
VGYARSIGDLLHLGVYSIQSLSLRYFQDEAFVRLVFNLKKEDGTQVI